MPARYWIAGIKLKPDKSNEKEFKENQAKVVENKANIKKAWSAAQLNAFVEEVLDKIGESPATGPISAISSWRVIRGPMTC